MKFFITILFVACTCRGFAQSDTIQLVFDYLNSREFRNACRDSITLYERKHKKGIDTSFLSDSHCFAPFTYYRKSVSVSESKIFYYLKKYDTISSGIYYMPAERCNSKVFLLMTFLYSGGIEIEYFEDQDTLRFRFKSGVSHIFHLAFANNNKIKFVQYGRLYR